MVLTMPLAPIVLFAYARVEHVRLTIEALLRNEFAADSDLIIYSDAAKTVEQQADVDKTRAYLKSISGFGSVTVNFRTSNLGLANSIVLGVTEVLASHPCAIVLEDDMVTSPYFLKYMNEALTRFADDDRVVSIHGYIYPVKRALPDAFFLRGADCWGWATWRRGWKTFNPNGQYLLDELKRRQLLRAFDVNGAYSFSTMLQNQIDGRNDSWAVRWHASAFLADKLTLYPGRSLVHNIGNDSSGTHCGDSTTHDVALSQSPIDLGTVQVVPSGIGLQAFEEFFRQSNGSLLRRLSRRTLAFLRNQYI
jgi:hypothetical protein